MAVILKRNELEYNQTRPCRLNLVDVGAQAEAIIAEARVRGQVIENQAQLEFFLRCFFSPGRLRFSRFSLQV